MFLIIGVYTGVGLTLIFVAICIYHYKNSPKNNTSQPITDTNTSQSINDTNTSQSINDTNTSQPINDTIYIPDIPIRDMRLFAAIHGAPNCSDEEAALLWYIHNR